MSVINLTPHSVEVYSEDQFVNLEKLNDTTWVADDVIGEPLAVYPSEGVARISVTTYAFDNHFLPGEIVRTSYGEAVGLPLDDNDYYDAFIVSLPMKEMSRKAGLVQSEKMVSPYKVVRSRENGSLVLGCMGFTY